jgi:MFS family permease
MATQIEKRTVNLAALAQGIALVVFPAASTIFTSQNAYGLSSTQYGAMFVPQVIMAITAALLGARLAGQFGVKSVYVIGLAANLGAMALLIASWLVVTNQALAFPLLLVATACLGAGFGLTTPSLNTFTAAFHPEAIDQAVLTLNALLGLGTALAPVFVAIFVGLGFWVGLPLLAGLLLLLLLVVSLRLPLQTGTQAHRAPSGEQSRARRQRGTEIPASFWGLASFAVLYGFCETMNGNWSQLDLTTNLGLSATVASLALTAFWAMVTGGRIVFAAIQRWFPSRIAYHSLPFLLAVAFLLIAALPKGAPELSVLTLAIAGFGCSALLPLTISFGQEKLVVMSGAVAGGVIAFYQFGYGVAAFGVGPLRSAGVTLPALFAVSAGVAVAMGVVSFVVARQRPSPKSLHPRPALAGDVAPSSGTGTPG